MTYEQNRNIFEKNIKIGIAVSLILHLLIFVLPAFFKEEEKIEFKEGFRYSGKTDIDLTQITPRRYEILNKGGGGGGGGGLDLEGGGPAKDLLSGIPVPSSEPINIEFGMVSYKAPDTIPKNQNLKPGLGFGTGEGTGSGSGSGSGSGNGKGAGTGSGTGDGTTYIPFTPKQILEVIPERLDDFNGIIKLSVRIGKEGLVKDHKVLQNTTNNASCLARVLEAAYKSKWQSVKIEGKIVEYWTEKTYRFE